MSRDLAAFLTRMAKLSILEMRPLIAEESQNWTQETVQPLVALLDKPPAVAKSLDKALQHDWALRWAAAIVESLGWLGLPAADALWKIVNDHPNDGFALRALVVVLRQPIINEAHFDELVADLSARLPKCFRAVLPMRAILREMAHEAGRNAAMKQLLTRLSSVTVLGPKKKDQQLLGEIVSDIMNPVKPPAAPEDPAHLSIVQEFCEHIVAGELDAAQALMSEAMKKIWSVKKLEKEVQEVTSHCGWPASIDEDPYFAGFRYSDLANGPAEPRLPKWISETNFRGWVWVSLGPPEDSDADFACNLGVGLMADKDRIAVGHLWLTAED